MAAAARTNGNLDDDFRRDIQALIREQQQSRGIFDIERDELNIYRSGSAPPTVEGSRTALGNFFGGSLANAPTVNGRNAGPSLTEEEMTSHPAYLSYYYSNENLNPRMPPPAVSKEDWRARQRFLSGPDLFGKIGDRSEGYVDDDASSLFSVQPGAREMLQDNVPQRHSAEWLDTDGLIGLSDVGLGSRRMSFADALQEELNRPTSAIGTISRPVSRSTYDNIDPRAPGSQLIQLHNGYEAIGDLQTGVASSGLVRVRSIGSSISHSFESSLGSSLARSTTPDGHLIRRTPSPCLPPIGVRSSDSNNHTAVSTNHLEGASAHMANSSDILSAMSGLSLSKSIVLDEDIGVQQQKKQELFDQPDLMFNMPSDKRQILQSKILNSSDVEPLRASAFHYTGYNDISKKSDGHVDASLVKSISNGQPNLHNQSSYANVYRTISSEGTTSQRHTAGISNIAFSNLKHESYTGNRGLPIMLNNQLDSEGLYLNANQLGYNLQLPTMDSSYTQYLHGTSDSILHGAASLDPSLGKNYFSDPHLDFPGYQNPYLGSLGAQNKLQYHMPFLNKSDGLNHRFFANDAVGVGMLYPANQMSSPNHSSLRRGGPARQNERSSRVHSIVQSGRESVGTWSSKNGVMEGYSSSLLEEFKNNKTRSFELSDIVGHVVEFSADQFGSRFIQQKLENASVEDKNNFFPEILPKAHALMTDVFGNYVIQKLFEHGTVEQRKQLASQLTGHVLQLSLQMYGCRVIQKALEFVDVDQQTQMVLELDGHVMKCVRDQNGNHVIQKCIECVPQEKIQLIIEAFYGHVVALSTHPYGCRVIQRVLEHCDDPKTQSIMMGEIMQSVCTLAQDQYGNYVIQHVLQHGKPEERTAIIVKLCGQIVEMSQQKYASNVIEKCLSYGTTEERQILINEMLGSTDENEPLQAMMKDQFANYVVQKVIETCDDQNRELILSRVKVHLSALKKYTYGKHIVARVEKLVAAGEKRIGVSTCSS